MIVIGNRTYRTLEDKIYLGNTQIGKVYHGNTLVYPEAPELGGIVLDTDFHSLNGNIYDTGYQATRNTNFEISYRLDSSTVNGVSREFFGTHHDNWTSRSNDFYRKLNADGSMGGTFTNDYLDSNLPYPSHTCFHLIIDQDGKTRFRFGGSQKNSSSSGSSTGDNLLSLTFGNKDLLWITKQGRSIKWGKNFGDYYYELNGTTRPDSSQGSGTLASEFSADATSGNLWLNGVNRFIKDPKVQRPKAGVSFKDDVNCQPDGKNAVWHSTTKSCIVYVMFWEEGDNNSKVLFAQRLTDELDDNGNPLVVFDKYSWDSNTNKFKNVPDTTIRPFVYCQPR